MVNTITTYFDNQRPPNAYYMLSVPFSLFLSFFFCRTEWPRSRCNGNLVVKRGSDLWVNACHILAVAGFHGPVKRRLIQRHRDTFQGQIDIVRKGDSRFIGTWIPPHHAIWLAKEYLVYDRLRPLLSYAQRKQPRSKNVREEQEIEPDSDDGSPSIDYERSLSPEQVPPPRRRRTAPANLRPRSAKRVDSKRSLSPEEIQAKTKLRGVPVKRSRSPTPGPPPAAKKKHVVFELSSSPEPENNIEKNLERLQTILKVQKELDGVLDPEDRQALGDVVKAVTRRCLDDENTLAGVIGFLKKKTGKY